jgi:predicted dehydrogenase
VLARGKENWVLANIPANNFLGAELEEFVACITDGLRPEVGGREAIAALAVVLAAIRSTQEDRVISIEESFDPSAKAETI